MSLVPVEVETEPESALLERVAAGAVWVTVVTIPWAGVVEFGGDTAAKTVGAVAVPIAVVAVAANGMRRRLLGTHLLALAFAAWAAASLFWSIDPERTAGRSVTPVLLVALLVLAWQVGPLSRRLNLVHAYLVGCSVTCVMILSRWASGTSERYTIGNTNPNNVAYLLIIGVAMAWYLSVTSPFPLQVLLARVFVPVAVVASLLTASRAAVFLLPIALLVVPLTIARLRVAGRGVVLVAAVGLAALLPSILPAQVLDRLFTAGDEVASGTLNERERLWEAAQRTIEDEPLLGVGTGASRDRMVDYLPPGARPQGAHNTFLSVGAELGVVGLVLFSLLLLSAVYDGLQAGPDAARLAVVVAMLLLVGLQVRHWEYEKPLWAILMILPELRLTAPRGELRGIGVHGAALDAGRRA